MGDAVFIVDFSSWRTGFFDFGENRVDTLLRVGVEQKKLASMDTRVAKQFEAVGLGAGQGVLMAENHASGIFFELASTDKAAASAALGCAGHGKFLRVSIERGCGVLNDDVLCFPILEGRSSARIDIVTWRIGGELLPFFDGDEVVRVGVVVLLLHLRRNLVIRLGKNFLKRSDVRVESKCAEWEDLSHGFSGANFGNNRN